jgi:hypothetical protein
MTHIARAGGCQTDVGTRSSGRRNTVRTVRAAALRARSRMGPVSHICRTGAAATAADR